MKSVAIIGYGWVGKAMHTLFPEAYIYDILGPGVKEDVNVRDIAFVCVPSPLSTRDDRLNTGIVEEVISWCECSLIVVRSTVNPGDCDSWVAKYNKRIVFQPEYLGETVQHPLLDQHTRPWLCIGGDPQDRRELIDLYFTTFNANTRIRQVTRREAEVIKLSENRAIAFKVAQCQELYDACEAAGLGYYEIIQAVYGDDPRFNLWHTAVYPENRGMNSKCIPKDVYAWAAWAESVGTVPAITRALLRKNREWVKDKFVAGVYR